MLTVQGFRESFPQFTEELFPDGRVSFYLNLAGKQLDRARWDDWWLEGCYLHAAHDLTLEREAIKSKDGTGGITAAAGPVVSTSKAVGGVSKSEGRAGTASSDDPEAGEYNLTWYGKKYWKMRHMVGAGGLQL
ncbi:conserved hypothetical protein [uncultured delta proteobacterium]|uniref:Uncharacterized protein n=1 Tax=uncultured delta proteobacterium TaxID=34034 RepID=A0A212J7Y0_9DELT|nr:conserved hypothetical protein [uncultured delta proteobacterium]